MKYSSAGAFRAALEQRLLALAQQTNTPVMRLRKIAAFDRLMARLLVVAKGRWLLKGALALDFRSTGLFRTTKDMDIAHRDNEEAATSELLAAQSLDLGDYFTFALHATTKLDSVLEGATVRYHVSVDLAGRPFEEVIVDVGFTDPLVPVPDLLHAPDLLGFAGIDAIEIPAVPLGQQVAEKVHAYTRLYGGRRHSSRVKDLIDLVLVQSYGRFDAGRLRDALTTTFDHRGTHPLPESLPPPPFDWGPAYRKMAIELRLSPDISVGHQLAAAFLDPILGGVAADDAYWDRGSWQLSDT